MSHGKIFFNLKSADEYGVSEPPQLLVGTYNSGSGLRR
jgi:hypothetical protein